MAISKEEIEKISLLARLELTDEEKNKLATELSAVLEYFKKLQEVDTSQGTLSTNTGAEDSRLRKDEVTHGTAQESILANAPSREGKFIKVKSVL